MQTVVDFVPQRYQAWICLMAWMSLGLAVAGCGKALPVGQPGDEKEAIAVTATCLEAWKQGNLAGLSTSTPPVRFTDDELMEGFMLEAYQVSDKTLPEAGRQRVVAQLRLRDPQGNTVERKASYQVTLRPTPFVFRADQ